MASTSTSFYADFVPVNRKKRRSKVAQREKQPLSVIVQRLRDELGQDDWLSQCQRPSVPALPRPKSMNLTCTGTI